MINVLTHHAYRSHWSALHPFNTHDFHLDWVGVLTESEADVPRVRLTSSIL